MLAAKDIMTTNVVTIDANASVAEALERLRESGVRCLIVQKRLDTDSYGAITQRDIAYKVIAEGLDPALVTVAEVMTRPLVSVGPDMSVQDVARLLRQTRLSRLPVISEGALQGIVSVSDIVAAV